ncbi:aldo/keto reductase [Streptomyces sp. NPDC057302]|uniref:aldo/keto reductase n=1 Tax=Streptomyces sp. NPDC057302 TaxID=3346094 RepID=UPI00363F3CF4
MDATHDTSIGVARRAVELGVTLIDTAYMYGWGANAVQESGPGEEASINGRPGFLREQVEQALRRLRVERIGQLDGRIGHIGLSEVTVDELDAARKIVDVARVQNRYSLLDREHEAVLDATPAQIALAWLLHRSPVVLPIPGTASLDHLAENVAAASLRLSDEQRGRLDGIALPAAGSVQRAVDPVEVVGAVVDGVVGFQ